MGTIATEAWVLYQGSGTHEPEPAQLKKETFTFPDITAHEVLAEPIYGCWEANMAHAIERQPVDICRQRGEERIVLGNAGVVRIVKTGPAVTTVKAGDVALLVAIGTTDSYGYMIKVVAYDAPSTMGVLARQMKLHEKQVIRLAPNTPYALQQWAAFSLRYLTAWANWKLAHDCWRLQMSEDACPIPSVWGWGGGVALAELDLAKRFGARVAMTASSDARLALVAQHGITPIDRRQFSSLHFDQRRYRADPEYKRAYQEAEALFLDLVKQHTLGAGVAIFIDNIGGPMFRATLKALARQGVVATAGWKQGMDLSVSRALECINHHMHVFTHGTRYPQAVAAVRYAEETGWMPALDEHIYDWDDIPQLAHEYAAGTISSYFPIFRVNPL